MNLPNKITLSRIILIPFMMFFYLADFIPYGKVIALGIFVVASFTDMLDGHIARKHNLITNMGKFLDPIADKVLTSAAFFLLATDAFFSAQYAVYWAIALTIIIGREFIVAALRQIAATKSIVIAADKWGKWKTVSQMAAIVALMLCVCAENYKWVSPSTNLSAVFAVIAMSVLGISVLMTIISGINYCVANKNVFKETK